MVFDKKTKGYGCKCKDDEIRKKSSSGGVFYYLAEKMIRDGGYVCGCIYDDDIMPKHIVSNKINDVKKMMGSKYVTSDIKECIEQLKIIVARGEKILFSGVPCQISAIRNIFPKYKNIIYVSVVCHGSIDRKIWLQYLNAEQKYGKIMSVTMRDKTKGWANYGLKILYENGNVEVHYRKEDGYFLKCFTDGVFQRDACLNCKFKGKEIKADILLGDGWNMEKVHPGLCDALGTSVVICITEKGNKYFENVSEQLEVEMIDPDKICEMNPRIVSPSEDIPKRKKFLKEFNDNPEKIKELCEKYSKVTLIDRIINRIKRY